MVNSHKNLFSKKYSNIFKNIFFIFYIFPPSASAELADNHTMEEIQLSYLFIVYILK